MSTLHRLKAYFGMVPIDELEHYGDDEYDQDYDAGYRSRAGGRQSRWTDHDPGHGSAHDEGRDSAHHEGRDRGHDRGHDRGRDGERDYDNYYDEPAVPARRTPPNRQWAADPPVRGALAVDPAGRAAAPVPAEAAPVNDGHPMSRITTLHPRNYNEARTIGEHYRDGIPVIMNLTAMEDADAKRLVDFAAGLVFATRGTIERVTAKVFLLSPPNVSVAAEEKQRIVEGGFFNQS